MWLLAFGVIVLLFLGVVSDDDLGCGFAIAAFVMLILGLLILGK